VSSWRGTVSVLVTHPVQVEMTLRDVEYRCRCMSNVGRKQDTVRNEANGQWKVVRGVIREL
jgi:hypothetical protein